MSIAGSEYNGRSSVVSVSSLLAGGDVETTAVQFFGRVPEKVGEPSTIAGVLASIGEQLRVLKQSFQESS